MRGWIDRLLGKTGPGDGRSARSRPPCAVYAYELHDRLAVAGSLRRLSPPGDFSQAEVSRCGTRVAYWGTPPGASSLPVPGVWQSRLDGEPAAVCLTRGPGIQGHPAWHPEGRRLVCFDSAALTWTPGRQFDVNRSSARLVWIDVESGESKPLTDGSATDERPAVSPDGGTVVFVSNRSGRMNLWRVNADGSGLAQLTDGPGPDYRPAFAPDGLRLAYFTRAADGSHQVRIRDLRGDGEPPGGWTRRFAWSHGPWWFADGRTLLVHALGRGARQPSLWTVDLATGEACALETPGLAAASHGTLDTAGRWLVCDSRVGSSARDA